MYAYVSSVQTSAHAQPVISPVQLKVICWEIVVFILI